MSSFITALTQIFDQLFPWVIGILIGSLLIIGIAMLIPSQRVHRFVQDKIIGIVKGLFIILGIAIFTQWWNNSVFGTISSFINQQTFPDAVKNVLLTMFFFFPIFAIVMMIIATVLSFIGTEKTTKIASEIIIGVVVGLIIISAIAFIVGIITNSIGTYFKNPFNSVNVGNSES